MIQYNLLNTYGEGGIQNNKPIVRLTLAVEVSSVPFGNNMEVPEMTTVPHAQTGSNNIIRTRTSAQQEFERKAIAAGYSAEDPTCDHSHYSSEKHGRRCTCGSMMWDAGD